MTKVNKPFPKGQASKNSKRQARKKFKVILQATKIHFQKEERHKCFKLINAKKNQATRTKDHFQGDRLQENIFMNVRVKNNSNDFEFEVFSCPRFPGKNISFLHFFQSFETTVANKYVEVVEFQIPMYG